MNINYFFLWNYNKFPFVYSLMNDNEVNILVINIHDSPDLKFKLSKLKSLEKITTVKLVKNNIIDYVYNLAFRIFVYPFKKKNNSISFYLDGFSGYYPFYIANHGRPDNVYFYEEGESIYKNDVLFSEFKVKGIKSYINVMLKKILCIKKNSIYDVKIFYVRDRIRFVEFLKSRGDCYYQFDIIEINEVKCIKKISQSDNLLLKEIFFSNIDERLQKMSIEPNKAIVLTQPIYIDNPYTKDESIKLFNYWIEKLIRDGCRVYIKLHPKEVDDEYLRVGIERLGGQFPFELLALYDIEFDKGLTYNSTAVNSTLIKERILIKDELKKNSLFF